MLKTAPLIDGGLGKLHEEMARLFVNMRTAKRWSKRLLGEEFYCQVVARSPGLEAHIKEMWRTFRELKPGLRERICDEFEQYNAISDLCNGIGIVSRNWRCSAASEFAVAAKELFGFLYSDTVNSAHFKTFSGQSLRDHFVAYRAAYHLVMCPFCGLEDYVDQDGELDCRDAYDHYLHKSAYPFAAVNPANLFPMCTKCNSTFKMAQEVLFSPETEARRRAPFPPVDSFNVWVTVDSGFESPPKVTVALASRAGPNRAEKFNTWMALFSIQARFRARVGTKRKDWVTQILAEADDPQNQSSMVAALKHRRDSLKVANNLGMQREFVVQIPFLSYCISEIKSLQRFFASEPQFRTFLMDRAAILSS